MSIHKNSISNNNSNTNEPSLVISYYLLKHCKLWVWDFDDTLIDTKYYYTSNMNPDHIRKRTDIELTNEVPQWRYFKRLVIYLVSHGKYVGIASFGTYEIIQAYMDRIMGFNQTFFNKNNIIAPIYTDRMCRRFQLPPNKNEYIYTMMKKYKIEDFNRVVLFDDLPSNIADGIAVGIIAIQIATPSNGDKMRNSDGGDKHMSGGVSYSGSSSSGSGSDGMFFGPWVMDAFDKKIENDCGKELYLNRTYTGITNRYYKDRKDSKDSKDSKETKNTVKTPYKGLSYDKIDFRNGVHESFLVPAPFGTGIGNRKITMNPEYRWNNMNVSKPPQWVNGNWEEATLGGASSSFWEKNQRLKKSKNDNDKNDDDNDDNDVNNDNKPIEDKYFNQNRKPIGINDYNGKLNEESNQVMGISEGFTNEYDNSNDQGNDDDEYDIRTKFGLDEKEKCVSCKKLEWNWIILVLIVIILMMTIIIYNVM